MAAKKLLRLIHQWDKCRSDVVQEDPSLDVTVLQFFVTQPQYVDLWRKKGVNKLQQVRAMVALREAIPRLKRSGTPYWLMEKVDDGGWKDESEMPWEIREGMRHDMDKH